MCNKINLTSKKDLKESSWRAKNIQILNVQCNKVLQIFKNTTCQIKTCLGKMGPDGEQGLVGEFGMPGEPGDSGYPGELIFFKQLILNLCFIFNIFFL